MPLKCGDPLRTQVGRCLIRVTLNHPGDPGPGPNNWQNYPVFTSVVSDGTNATVQGKLHGRADTVFQLEFFASSAECPSYRPCTGGQVFPNRFLAL